MVAAVATPSPRPPAPSRLTIVPPERPVCREQQRCAIDLLASGGRGPYDWSILQGKLPAGLSLDRHTGRIFGTPITPEQSTVTITVRDTLAQAARLQITIVIRSLLDIAWQTAPVLDQTNLAGSLRVTNYSGNEESC